MYTQTFLAYEGSKDNVGFRFAWLLNLAPVLLLFKKVTGYLRALR